jgi:hypothetical protein
MSAEIPSMNPVPFESHPVLASQESPLEPIEQIDGGDTFESSELSLPAEHINAGLTPKESEAILNEEETLRGKTAALVSTGLAIGALVISQKYGLPFTRPPEAVRDNLDTVKDMRQYGVMFAIGALATISQIRTPKFVRDAQAKLSAHQEANNSPEETRR